MKRSRTLHQLGRTIMFATVRGAATAAGSGLIALFLHWITYR